MHSAVAVHVMISPVQVAKRVVEAQFNVLKRLSHILEIYFIYLAILFA